MTLSVFDLFKIGIGPSSSHTVGPMLAARLFVLSLKASEAWQDVSAICVELFGSLAFTGRAHGTDRALMMGLEGEKPDEVDPLSIPARVAKIQQSGKILLLAERPVSFDEKKHFLFNKKKKLPLHPNGMEFTAFDAAQNVLSKKIYYSVGGGFVVDDKAKPSQILVSQTAVVPYPFSSARELLVLGKSGGKKIHEMMLENEKIFQPENDVRSKLLKIWQVMQSCVQRGLSTPGILPGGLMVRRRAPEIFAQLNKNSEDNSGDPLRVLDWVNLYALAVSEENAAAGRVVTAPTNGAAGVIPAVMHYFARQTSQCTDDKIVEFFLTAGAIGILYKMNASISGAEVGCQGEVGVACSMAAGALAGVLGGSNEQIENAAEIGMEHNLGLTCDPVGGLVQIPCIERNAMGSVKAINAARMALSGDGLHKISLDKVIQTMRQTGHDMSFKYKETSRGGLATNIIEC